VRATSTPATHLMPTSAASGRSSKLARAAVTETGLSSLGKVACLAAIAPVESVAAARSPIAAARLVAEIGSLISETGLTLARPPVATTGPIAEIRSLVTETALALSRPVVAKTTLPRPVVAETALSGSVARAARTIAAAGLQNLIATAAPEVELAVSGMILVLAYLFFTLTLL
jgi:hypothetical protein